MTEPITIPGCQEAWRVDCAGSPAFVVLHRVIEGRAFGGIRIREYPDEGSARDDVGIDALIDAIDEHARHLETSGRAASRRRTGRIARIERALATRYGRFGLATLTREATLEAWADARAEVSTDRVIDELGAHIETRLRGGNGARSGG